MSANLRKTGSTVADTPSRQTVHYLTNRREPLLSGFRVTVSARRTLPLALIITIGSTYAFAELRPATTKLTCFPIRPGDTAARLAQRLTGSIDNRHQSWFQIVDPATATMLPKSRYNEIEPGWRVCVATDMLRRAAPEQPQYLPVSAASVPLSQTTITTHVAGIDLRALWWAAPLFVLMSGLGLVWTWRRIDERRTRLDVLRGFSHRFIYEFERPLLRNAVTPPVRSRVRFAPARRCAEILIAPGNGRTYPNLVDHKRNVEYDVARIMRLLKDESFSHGPLRVEGQWVVIPFHFETDRLQEGAP